MRGGSRGLLLWSGSGSCSPKQTTTTPRNGQLDGSNVGFWRKAELCWFKADAWSQPNAVVSQIRRAPTVSNSASLKLFATDNAAVGWAKRRQGRRVPTIGGAGCRRWARRARKLARQGRIPARLCPPYGRLLVQRSINLDPAGKAARDHPLPPLEARGGHDATRRCRVHLFGRPTARETRIIIAAGDLRPNGLDRNPAPPHPNRCASQNAAPAARPPTRAV